MVLRSETTPVRSVPGLPGTGSGSGPSHKEELPVHGPLVGPSVRRTPSPWGLGLTGPRTPLRVPLPWGVPIFAPPRTARTGRVCEELGGRLIRKVVFL